MLARARQGNPLSLYEMVVRSKAMGFNLFLIHIFMMVFNVCIIHMMLLVFNCQVIHMFCLVFNSFISFECRMIFTYLLMNLVPSCFLIISFFHDSTMLCTSCSYITISSCKITMSLSSFT